MIAIPSKMPVETQYRQKQRSAIADSIISTSAWWKMHDAGADGAVLDEFMGSVSGLSNLAIGGTTASIWTDRPGWFTPDGIAQNSVVSGNDAADSLCSMNDLAGGLLVVFELTIGNNPLSGVEVIAHYGTNGAGGMWGVNLSFGANANIRVDWQPIGGTFISKSVLATAFIGEDIKCAVYFDVANSNIEVFVNTGSSESITMSTDGILPGTNIVNAKLGIFCRPLTVDRLFGGAGSASEMRDLFMIRFETDKSGSIANIVQGFIDSTPELPWELEGL